MSDDTPLTVTGRRGGDDATLQSLDDTEDNRRYGTQRNDEAVAMEVDDKAEKDRRRQDRAIVKWRDEHQAREASIQASASLSPSQCHTDSGGPEYISEQELVKWADQF